MKAKLLTAAMLISIAVMSQYRVGVMSYVFNGKQETAKIDLAVDINLEDSVFVTKDVATGKATRRAIVKIVDENYFQISDGLKEYIVTISPANVKLYGKQYKYIISIDGQYPVSYFAN